MAAPALAAARVVTPDARLPPGLLPSGTAGRILEVALALFARNGFHGTSIRDLGRALELKPANLYEHYPSKEHVLAELVRLGHDLHLTCMRQAILDGGEDPASRLCALVEAHVRMHAGYAMLAVVANNEMHVLSRDLVAPALALRKQSEELLIDVVQRGTLAGDFDPPDALLTAVAIGGMGMRVANWYKPGLSLSIDQIAEIYADLALRMVGARPPGKRR